MDGPTCAAVLVVEDEENYQKAVADALKAEGFQVYEAASQAMALTVLSWMPRPALVLADLMAREIDGRSLVAALGPEDRFVILPVIVRGIGGATAREYTRAKRPINMTEVLRIVESLCLRRT